MLVSDNNQIVIINYIITYYNQYNKHHNHHNHGSSSPSPAPLPGHRWPGLAQFGLAQQEPQVSRPNWIHQVYRSMAGKKKNMVFIYC